MQLQKCSDAHTIPIRICSSVEAHTSKMRWSQCMPYVAASMSSNGAPGMPSHAKKLRTKRLTCRQLQMFAFESEK